jgi:hypothetical protein
MLKAPPHDFRAGAVAPTAPPTPAELGDPGDGLASRRRLGRRRGDPMDGTRQRLPCVGLQPHATGGIRDGARHHGGVKNPPRQHAVACQSTAEALRLRAWPRCEAAPALHKAVPHVPTPATRGPLDTLKGVVDRRDRPRGAPQPCERLHLDGRLDCTDLYGPQRDGRYPFGLTRRRGAQGPGTRAQRQCRFPGGWRAAPRDVQEALDRHGLGHARVPPRALRRVDPAMPGGAHQAIHPWRAWRGQDVRDLGFPIADADQARRRTPVPRGVDGVETVEPRLTCLLAAGERLAPGALPHGVWVPRPALLCQQAQGDPLRCEGAGGRDPQAVTRRVPQRSHAFGDASMRPVGCRRLVHGEDQRHRVPATRGRLNRPLEPLVGGHVVVREQALSGFAQRAAATGFRPCGTGTLGQGMGQLDHTLGPPQVAEVRVGTLRDGPTRGLEEVAHLCFLAQWLEPDIQVEHPCPS